MAEATDTSSDSPQSARRPLWLPAAIALGIFLCLVLAILIFVFVLRPALFPAQVDGIPLEITRVSPQATVSPAPVSAPVADVGGEAISLAIPVALELGGQTFSVTVSTASGGAWLAPASASGAAIWVDGTVINYVIGLETTADNTALLDQVATGDSILLRLSNGTQVTFRITQKESVSADDATIFVQQDSGLTLLLLGSTDQERLAVFADVALVEEPALDPTASTIPVGQQTQVGDALVVLERGHAEPGDAGAMPGTMAFLIEFTLENTGQAPLDASAFVMELVDGLDNRYLPSASAATQGDYGPLLREVSPGESVSITAGYVVPNLMAGPELTWVFGSLPGSEVRAYFAIPYEQAVASPAIPDVDVYDAFLDEDEGVLHVLADIYNDGEAPLEVTTDDFLLSSSEGTAALRSTAPPLPWTIPAGDYQDVELLFARPGASSAIVTILGFTFEITGLP